MHKNDFYPKVKYFYDMFIASWYTESNQLFIQTSKECCNYWHKSQKQPFVIFLLRKYYYYSELICVCHFRSPL